ncbi:hypothetical protein DMA11_21450 [Marinilabiliaceae bacterium JC017]|nr:hypothetical protein DMA11_21450 [Marinilabiliaceae bacterium JC017]
MYMGKYLRFRKKLSFLFLLLIGFMVISLNAYGQTGINGQVNDAIKIIKVTNPDVDCDECNNTARCRYVITVEDGSVFSAGDRVLIVQMKGATINTSNDANGGKITDIGNAGNYEFFVIGDIIGNDIYPRGRLKRTYDNAGLIQLVKVPSYSGDVEINSDLVAESWNPATGRGGIVAIFVDGTLIFNADIKVHGMGYQGVTVNKNGSPDNCTKVPDMQMIWSAGNSDVSPKGQGIVVDDPRYNGGRAPRANGGGGGVSGDSGGGGGSNFGAGGNGGNRWCDSADKGMVAVQAGGLGGVPMEQYIGQNRIFFGGAGGAGFVTSGNSASAAHGGGLVVIRAKRIIGNGHTIDASGSAPASTGTGIDGGGGGGGGGTVAFEIQSFEGALNVNVSGGDGQDLETNVLHGPGGGGGGGAFLYNLSALPAGITVDASGGEGGEHRDGKGRNGSKDGAAGGVVSYFNLVYSEEDFDDDDISDFCDLDTDNDGLLDSDEDGGSGFDPSKDADGDHTPNYKDSNDVTPGFPVFVDTNGDGINDIYDRDKDGIPDFKDLDCDNDGRVDVVEAGGQADASGALANYEDRNNDGLSDNVDPDNGGKPLAKPDSDGDGSPDFLDLDSDNDGVSDAYESATSTIATGNDTDNDGIDDAFDANQGGVYNTLIDRDGDGINDMFDLDSDNDGITDFYETAGVAPKGVDADADGIDDAFDVDKTFGADSDGDWIDDASKPKNSDTDGLFDFHDLDADGDGIIDNIEGQPTVGYVAPSGIDADKDGLDNAYDPSNGGTYLVPVNIDGDAEPDFLDTNSDADNESDWIEAYDTNEDGVADTAPAGSDSDNDGIDDNFDAVNGNDPTDGGELATDYPDVDDPGNDRDWRQNVPRVTLSLDKAILTEDIQVATFTASLNRTTYQDVTVNLAYSGSALGSGKDYTAVKGANASNASTIVIPAGQLAGTVTVTSVDDDLVEESETVIVDVASVVNAKEVGTQQKSVTISDNDAAGITVSAISNTINENGQKATFSIVLNSQPTHDVTIALSSNNINEGQPKVPSVTFTSANWNVAKVIEVIPVNDELDEEDQSFTIITHAVTSGDVNYSGKDGNDVDVVIQDDDETPVISANTIELAEDVSKDFEVYDVNDDNTGNDTDPDNDAITYSIVSGNETGVFALNSASGKITVLASEKLDFETIQKYDLVVSASDGTNGTSATITVNIRNTDSDVSLTVEDVNVTEGDNGDVNMQFTINSNVATATDLTVDYSLKDVTATKGIDYSGSNGIATINKGNKTTSVLITVKGDELDEDNESLTFTLSNNSAGTITDANATGTIEDDDHSPVIEDVVTSVSEDAANGKVVHNISDEVSPRDDRDGDLDAITYSILSGNEAGVFAINSATGEISVKDETKLDYETTQQHVLHIQAVDGKTNSDVADVTINVLNTDNDIILSVADAIALDEGDAGSVFLTFRIGSNHPVAENITIKYATSNGTAKAGSDYVTKSGTATISAGQSSSDITVEVKGDNETEANEDVTFTISDNSAGTLGDAIAKGVITNDDKSPVISNSIKEISEDAANNQTVHNLNDDITGNDSDGDGDAIEYSFTGGNEAGTFGINSSTGEVFVANAAQINFESVTKYDLLVKASDGTNELTATVTVNIANTDNDVRLNIDNGTLSESEAGSKSLNFVVRSNVSVASDLTINYNVVCGSATLGDDFTNSKSSVTIPAGSDQASVQIMVVDDQKDENDETFTITLSGNTAGTLVDASAIGTITDDDNKPVILDASVNVAEDAYSGVVHNLDDDNTKNDTDLDNDAINYSITGGTGVGIFVIDSSTGEIKVKGGVELDYETTSNYNLNVKASDGTNESVANITIKVINTDSDVTLSVSGDNVNEGNVGSSSISFSITTNVPVANTVKVDYTTVDGTATAGSDYLLKSGTAILSAGENKFDIVVPVKGDQIDEADESFKVQLCNPIAATIVTSEAKAIIRDDDNSRLTVENAQVFETDGKASFMIKLDNAVQGGTTVTWSIENVSTNAADYTNASGTVSFEGYAGETKSIDIAIVDDEVVESEESFTIKITSSNALVDDNDIATGSITDNDGPAILSMADMTIDENGSGQFTITVDKAVEGGFDVRYNFSDDSALGGKDYDNTSHTLHFSGTAGESKLFTVAGINDDIVEGSEVFYVSLSSTHAKVNASATAKGTVIDDDAANVTIENVEVTEGAIAKFTIKLNRAIVGGADISYSFTNGSATGGSDFDATTGKVYFNGTANEIQAFTVVVNEDFIVEGDESFTVNLASNNPLVGADDTAIATIKDNDGTAEVTVENVSGNEGETITFSVKLNKAVQGGVEVTYGLSNGKATVVDDYEDVSGPLNFDGNAGEVKTFTVLLNDDAVVESKETFKVGLNTTHALVMADDEATGTILDLDGPATVTIADVSVDEDGLNIFTVSVDKAVEGGFAIDYTFTDGTAIRGTDFVNTPGKLIFAGEAGEQQTFNVAGINDDLVEGSEVFTVNLSSSCLLINTDATAKGTIIDDDAASVMIEDVKVTEGQKATFSVSLNKAVVGGLVVTYRFADGSAVAESDFIDSGSIISFNGTEGETHTFDVFIIDDEVVEQEEYFTVSLASSNKLVGADDTAKGVITDNDGRSEVTIENMSGNEGESITFSAKLSNAVQGGVEVTYGLSKGTATAIDDYEDVSGLLSFEGDAGEVKTFTVNLADDAVVESKETFTVNLNTTNDLVNADDQATVTILDLDGPATVTIADVSVDEDGANIFTVSVDKAVEGGFAIDYTFTDGTAIGGTDFVNTPGKLIFAGEAGEQQTFNVAGIKDDLVEGSESFTVNLNSSSLLVNTDATAKGTIIDEDAANVTIEDVKVTEGETATFTITLNKVVVGGVDVTYHLADGSAIAGSDFTNSEKTINFVGTAGETHTFDVSIPDDAVVEYEEFFTVSLTSSNKLVGADDTAKGLITDNDGPATVSIEEASGVEGGDLQFQVTLDKVVQEGVVVNYHFTDGTATGSTDFNNTGGSLTFTGKAGEVQTITVKLNEDDKVEANETFTVNLDTDNDLVNVGTKAIGTITDNDVAGITVSAISGNTSEAGSTATFTVKLNSQPESDVTLKLRTSDASEGEIAESRKTLTFTAVDWNKVQTVTVTGVDDDVDDGDINYSIILDAAASADGNYNGFDVVDVAVMNEDNDLPNTAPVAEDDTAEIIEGGEAKGNVLDNDRDADGDVLTIELKPVTGPTNGTVVIEPDGAYTYTPNDGFFGTDRFTYRVCDNGSPSACSTAVVTIIVTAFDEDGDGIPTEVEGDVDTDNDGTPDYQDTDSDDDGISDQVEGVVDTDNDGTSDYKDTDSDEDGISDKVEGAVDTDNDGASDYKDTDSDDDGIPDSEESNGDCDNDGVVDRLDKDVCSTDEDGDGIPTEIEGTGDTDNDGIPDFLDTDSDDDGISDKIEGTVDSDGDGKSDYKDTDSDSDNITDKVEGNVDSDGDKKPDYIDTDSDGDEISDEVEGTVDTDKDGVSDYVDGDSDNDGLPDWEEGVVDTDQDGTSDYRDTDSDGDGISDKEEGLMDIDGDGDSNYRDSDSDGDDISDEIEGNIDTDLDGKANYIDLDSDNDKIPDAEEEEGDCDNDGIINRLDPDQCVEKVKVAKGFSPNGDGINDYYIIPELDQYSHVSIEVFNRWGNVVFKEDRYANKWDGMSNVGMSIGDKLPVATYFYVIVIHDTNEKLTGYIYLNR